MECVKCGGVSLVWRTIERCRSVLKLLPSVAKGSNNTAGCDKDTVLCASGAI